MLCVPRRSPLAALQVGLWKYCAALTVVRGFSVAILATPRMLASAVHTNVPNSMFVRFLASLLFMRLRSARFIT